MCVCVWSLCGDLLSCVISYIHSVHDVYYMYTCPECPLCVLCRPTRQYIMRWEEGEGGGEDWIAVNIKKIAQCVGVYIQQDYIYNLANVLAHNRIH